MKRNLVFLLIFLPVVSFSQINQTDVNGLRQGLWKKQQPNGRLLYEGYFKDGEPVGEWKRFHEGGQVKAIINYAENSDTAYTQLFDVWGKKVAEGSYVNEKKEGSWTLYANNVKIALEQYKDGIKDGECLRFYNTGEVLEKADWKNGKKEGDYRLFYTNGEPFMQCKFSNNMRNGLCISYYQNGDIEMEAEYKNSLRHGEWKFFNPRGDSLYSLFYNEGVLLNPEVRDSIDNLQMKNMESGKEQIVDPEKYMDNPSEYMMKMNIYR
ncbi:toxin-antitoxin system YwqK family antitoxin [Maribellus maritimus]|uniref:toxin-antitoxin system YwqK family antitoxin n=1 Tax=Maribellus maritimus TaxID=2870838 RepID=UPI001EEC608F|nr:toxin-antitoxin system YwqK family antitoxin [Maribellus maritimus]MCG6190418.1 toxin-antitoxin system YwqK family antitoxin [Maribellus maritimus]